MSILELFIKYKRSFTYILCISFLVNVINIMVPLSFMAIIDRVISSQGFGTLNIILFALLLCALVEFTFGYISSRLYNWCSISITAEFIGSIFNTLFLARRKEYERFHQGEILSRLAEVNKIKSMMDGWLLGHTIDIFFMLLFLGVMLCISKELTLIILITVPLHILQYFIFGKKITKFTDRVFDSGAKYSEKVLEAIRSINELKSEGNINFARDRVFSEMSNSLVNAYNLTNTENLSGHLSELFHKIGEAMIIFAGAYLVMHGKISLGELVAFSLLKDRVTQPLIKIASIWEDIIQFKLSYKRINDLLTLDTESDNGYENIHAEQYDIKIKNVTMSFNEKCILKQIDMNINKGEIACIVGESGIGKSSLTMLISRMIDEYSGDIFIGDYDIKELSLSSLRSNISYVHQNSTIYSGTIRDNITLGNTDISTEWLHYCGKFANIHDFIISLPNGYDTEISSHLTHLSGGQIQRIAIARAIASNKKILILDEATSALDIENEEKIMRNILSIRHEKIIIIVTHRLAITKIADKVFLLNNGRITLHKNLDHKKVL